MSTPAHVLVALDESPQSAAAFEFALTQFPDATITVLTVIDPIEAGYSTEVVFPSGEWFDAAREAAQERFESVQSTADTQGIDLKTVIEVGRPARTIVEYADEHGVEHIIMGGHGRTGVARVLLGSVAETVVRRSPVPVTVVR